jgi:hypothetical protein
MVLSVMVLDTSAHVMNIFLAMADNATINILRYAFILADCYIVHRTCYTNVGYKAYQEISSCKWKMRRDLVEICHRLDQDLSLLFVWRD